MAVRQDASTGQMVDDGQSVADSKPVLHAKVYSPYKVYFDQPVQSVSGVNGTGPFDILPRHHNFISLLKPCELMLASEAGDVKIKIGGGIMHVHADNVTVYLDV